ncbi:MAG: ABC transporter substrate-binding protein, partial [Alphaproteobacteria bacterium]
QDVIDSMNIHRGEDSTSGGKSMMAVVSDIKADGDNVVFELSEPVADFPFYMAQYNFTVCPSKDGVVDQSGVGTGPYVLEAYEPGVRGSGKRNPNYFKDGTPFFDSFDLLSVNDSAALSTGLLTGQFHVIQPVDPKTASRLDASPGVSVVSVAGGSTITMPMHADKAPFNNVDFRLAMKYAVDREELRDKVFQGHASLANDHPVAPFDRFYNPDIPQRGYDIDKAKYHLKKSGHEGVNVQIHASDAAFAGSVDAGVLYSESAKKAGINLEVVKEPIDGYWSNVWTKVPFCYCYWGARPTPDLILSLGYICGATWGDTNWCHEKFTSLVAAARVELDTAKRKAIYADVQQILHDEGSTIVPVFQNLVHGISDKVDTGGEILGAQPLDTFRLFEKWSFKA